MDVNGIWFISMVQTNTNNRLQNLVMIEKQWNNGNITSTAGYFIRDFWKRLRVQSEKQWIENTAYKKCI